MRLALVAVLVFGLAGRVPAAPLPPVPQPSAEQLRAALGQSPAGPEVKVLVKAFDALPTVWYADWVGRRLKSGSTNSELSWERHGVKLKVDKDNVSLIYLHSQGADDYAQYRGQLPEGLTFADSPEAVAKKLGPLTRKPFLFEREERKGGQVVDAIDYTHSKGGLAYDVRFYQAKGEAARIHQIVIYHDKPK